MTDLRGQLREFWDHDAATYDDSPSHALSDPVEAAAWRAILERHLPAPPARILDAGAGTGAITKLLVDLGYRATALDISVAMLDRARQKLAGEEVDFVVAPADEPPEGPFDAVVERHSLWTNPDPVGTLSAWRRVAPEGRLLVFESIDPYTFDRKARYAASDVLRKILGRPHDHHDEYSPELRASLPLLGASSPGPLLEAVASAGWRGIRLQRLRDVEWARRQIPPRMIHALESAPLFAVAAEAR
ncbi:MAG TPA: class I SAM-dependent methyltransferase [Actinomycetota bacterium]|nr:class I SAM-dependent methyltransferase [Actinomycetota bacterium]